MILPYPFTQLGVNSGNAMILGGLTNKPRFFGSATAEVISQASAGAGGWNGNSAHSLISGGSWQLRSATPTQGSAGGALRSGTHSGAMREDMSHRTILLGY